jgi:nucleoside-diphosphate-sugar epimerase
MKPRVLLVGSADFMSEAIRRRLAASEVLQLLDETPPPDDAARITESVARCDAVVNSMNGAAEAIRRNGAALAAALNACAQPVRLVHLSSMTVYGSVEGVVNEDARLDASLGAYAAARIAAEQMLRQAAPQTTVLRLGVEYGPDCPAWTLRIAHLLRQRRLGDLGAAGDGCCNLVHVDDVALAVERALITPVALGQAFNLAVPNSPSWNEYLTRFALAIRAVPVRRVGSTRLKIEKGLFAPPLKIIEILSQRFGVASLGMAPPIPSSLVRAFAQGIRLDSRRASEVLGITWSDLDVELRRIARQLSPDAKSTLDP